MLNTALTFTGWLHKDDTIRLVQDKRSSTFTLWPFYATFWGGEKLHPSWRGILERRGMRLLYHILPGSDMFEESGRAWHCACPEPFLQFWAMWWWERPAACGPQLAFPRMSWAEWGLCVGDAPYAAQSWQEQPQCLSLSIMAKIGLWKISGLGSALRRGVAGAVAVCLAGRVHACVPTLHSDNPEVSQALVWWGQRGRQWAQDTVLRKQPASASTALFPHAGPLAAGVAILVVQTSSSLQSKRSSAL